MTLATGGRKSNAAMKKRKELANAKALLAEHDEEEAEAEAASD